MYHQLLYFSLFLVYISTCFGWQGYEHELMKNLPTQSPEIGETFIWQTDNNFKIPTNWENNDIPCDDDRIKMDADKEIVAMVEDGLRSTRWEIPNDGIILFADKTVIGRKGTWQCQRKSPEDVFYAPPGMLGNFLDVSKWKLAGDTRQRPRLHSEMVPSQEDEAIFPSEHALQVQIDQIVAVKKLIYNDQVG
uniref:Protein amnionless n=1 Tax=Acrobeloides nanus TaxID=290746 RepID=A0A914DJ59_9BILA